jgi:hypothetical protein
MTEGYIQISTHFRCWKKIAGSLKKNFLIDVWYNCVLVGIEMWGKQNSKKNRI